MDTPQEVLTTEDFEELVWRGKKVEEELSPIELAAKNVDIRARLKREGYKDDGSFTV